MSDPSPRGQSRSETTGGGRGGALRPQLEMIRRGDPVPEVPQPAAGYVLRKVQLEDRQSYSQTFRTAFDEPSPFADLIRNMLPDGFFVVEHQPTGAVVATSTAAKYPKAQHPDGHSLQWVVGHADHLGTGSGRATVAAATQVLADLAPRYSYLSTDDFRLPAINIYLKLGWQPLLFQQEQIARWAMVFEKLGMEFNENDWQKTP